MHKTSTKPIGVLAMFLALMLGACGGEGVTGSVAGGVTGLDTGLPRPESLAGTWKGGDGKVGLVWHLTQAGDSITGSSEFFGRGRPAAGGRVEGTVTGSDFTFRASHAAETESEAGCPTKLEGTLTVKPFDFPTDPRRYYPEIDRPFETKQHMFGRVTGTDCAGSFVTTIRLLRD